MSAKNLDLAMKKASIGRLEPVRIARLFATVADDSDRESQWIDELDAIKAEYKLSLRARNMLSSVVIAARHEYRRRLKAEASLSEAGAQLQAIGRKAFWASSKDKKK